ncbi:hypothetical protein DMUE_5767 [Dictyocoela muelleri]|nr:hypothetical protein DMUE_5767 [Dictyocoela muelleri]
MTRENITKIQEYHLPNLSFFATISITERLLPKNILRATKLSRGTIMILKYKIENKIRLYNQKNKILIGGIGSIVEFDESLMSSAKYGRGRYPEQTWVFGIL